MSQRIGTIQSNYNARKAENPIQFRNDSGEAIPPHAIMRITGAEGVPVGKKLIVVVDKPDSSDAQYLINGPHKVRDGKTGRGRFHSPMVIAFTGTDPVAGDAVGPSSGSWLISTSGRGYVALGGAEDGVVLCREANLKIDLEVDEGDDVLRVTLKSGATEIDIGEEDSPECVEP